MVCLESNGAVRWAEPVEGGIPWGGVSVADCNGDERLEILWISLTGLVECRAPDGRKILAPDILAYEKIGVYLL